MLNEMPTTHAPARVAVVIPCHNEEATITKVIDDFRLVLPDARIYVFDNDSRDGTAKAATSAGAEVHRVGLRGKGNVVRRMFADVDADVYVLVDGDDTYHAPSAPRMIEYLLAEALDMVVGVRAPVGPAVYRPGHAFGNRLLSSFLSRLFGRGCNDILSGYRVFSRRFVKSFPVFSSGFEIETELTVHTLEMSMPIGDTETPYKERPAGSASKLKTYSDGARILFTILRLFSIERPLTFYGGIAVTLALTAIVIVVPIFLTYLDTGLVPRFPTAILATGMMVSAGLSFFAGLILATVTRGRQEAKALAYLQCPPPPALHQDRERAPRAADAVDGIKMIHPHGHFYSPVVDPAKLDPQRLWPATPQVAGIDFNDAGHEAILRDVFPRFLHDYDYPEHAGASATQYYTGNPSFGWLDSRALFALLREWRPRRVLEIGGGYSTLLSADINHRFLDGSVQLTCIEPYPQDFLRLGIPGLSKLIEVRVQDLPLEEFASLQNGDVLFIDSSHVVKTGSDVNFLFLEVLPRLNPGVRVHVHDIFLPHEYRQDWVMVENRSWNEQYLLQALLTHSRGFRVVFGCNYAYSQFPDLVRKALALPGGQTFTGGSFWIERIDQRASG